MPNTPEWLTARPIAHRGLHDAPAGLIENTLPAFEAAIARGFAIELDVQGTADGNAVVFHDETLDRLTGETGLVKERTTEELAEIAVTGSGTRIPSLAKVLAEVDGRTPLIIEVKSIHDGDMALADAVCGALQAYHGPAAIMSFDPAVMAHIRSNGTGRPAGIVSAPMTYTHWHKSLSFLQRLRFGTLLHGPGFSADFISYEVKSLPALSPLVAKKLGGKALMCWTVRDAATARRAMRWVDQITFEGFDPHEALDGRP